MTFRFGFWVVAMILLIAAYVVGLFAIWTLMDNDGTGLMVFVQVVATLVSTMFGLGFAAEIGKKLKQLQEEGAK